MSINLDSGGGPAQWQESDTSNLATGMKSRPCSFGGWIRITEALSGIYKVMSIQNSAAANNYYSMHINGNDQLETIIDDATTKRTATEIDAAQNIITNTWHHIIIVVETFNHRGYVDGVSNYTQGITADPASLNEVSAGTLDGSTTSTFHGDLCRWGFWSSALSQADITLLASNKYAPPLVSSGTLEHYFKWGTKDDADTQDSLTWATVTGSPTTTSDVPGIVDVIGNLMMMLA